MLPPDQILESEDDEVQAASDDEVRCIIYSLGSRSKLLYEVCSNYHRSLKRTHFNQAQIGNSLKSGSGRQ